MPRTLALTGQRAGTGPAPTLAACSYPGGNTGPDGPTGWHKACPYTGGLPLP
ncbi:MAG: hypothetical protein II949_10170 [Prevotella sp.]|nr:hypothetical protein [Prevotella sp.]